MKLFFLAWTLVFSTQALAFNLDWTGAYRFEYFQIDRPSLGDPFGQKSYGLNYLYLQPKFVASDGIDITARFDILSSTNEDYRYSQLGQLWGGTAGSRTDTSYNNTTRQNQGGSSVIASQLYLKAAQEYGSFVVGRMPYEFGLGISHNAGKGAFDHWMDTHDLVAYKFIVGNLFFMPMLGKAYHESPGQGNSTTEQLLQIQYDSADSGSLLGLLFERKNASNGAVADGGWLTGWQNYYGKPGAAVEADFSYQRTSFILGKEWSTFGFKIEGGFAQGQTGVRLEPLNNSSGQLRMNGYGIASEVYYHPTESKWDLNVRTGIATGDDPSTTENYEGYQFNRNYDIAMLLFNQRLGMKDFLGTNPFKNSGYDIGSSFDDESISNAFYFSPRIKYVWNDKVDLINTITYAQLLNKVSGAVDATSDLGFEWDIEVVYRPRERIQWINQFGYLFTGSAFENGTAQLSKNNTFGFASKAAISF